MTEPLAPALHYPIPNAPGLAACGRWGGKIAADPKDVTCKACREILVRAGFSFVSGRFE